MRAFLNVLFAAFAVLFALGAGSYAAEPQNIVIYGGAGRIGSKFVDEALSRGHTVTSIDIKAPDASAPRRERLTEKAGDVLKLAADPSPISGADVVIIAINSQDVAFFTNAARAVVAAVRKEGGLNGPRLIWLGGASSLMTRAGGPTVGEVSSTPPGGRPIASRQGHTDVLAYLREVKDVRWTFLSPAMTLDYDGPRTGKYRIGGDIMVSDNAGNSRISVADLAVVMIDEVETRQQIGKRFTAGY